MNTKWFVGLVVVLIAVGGIWYFAQKPNSENSGNLKIGVLVPLTQTSASYGEDVRAGVELAQKQYGKNSIEVIYEDSKCDVKAATDAAIKLVTIDHVQAIIGDVCWTEIVAKITEPAKVLVMSTGSAQSEVRDAGDYVFRLKLDSSVDSKALADKLYKDFGARKISLLHVNDNWGTGIAVNFRAQFEKLGGQIVTADAFKQTDNDFRTYLSKIKSVAPDYIMMTGYPGQAGLIAKQARELGVSAKLAAYRGGIGDETINLGGSAAEGLIFIDEFNDVSPTDATKSFTQAFKDANHRSPGLFAVMGYDAFNLYAAGLTKCGVNTECIKNYFYNLKNYQGAEGVISFDDHGDVLKNLVLKTIKGGQFVKAE